MSQVTIDGKTIEQILKRLESIEEAIKCQPSKINQKYMTEKQAMLLTGLSKDSLYRKRKAGILRYSTSTGRKIQYLVTDIDKYISGNS